MEINKERNRDDALPVILTHQTYTYHTFGDTLGSNTEVVLLLRQLCTLHPQVPISPLEVGSDQ
jgi:hypothetical protein